jgi:hypothetical protein
VRVVRNRWKKVEEEEERRGDREKNKEKREERERKRGRAKLYSVAKRGGIEGTRENLLESER